MNWLPIIMKKFIMLAAAVGVMSLALVGCGGNNDAETPDSTPVEEETVVEEETEAETEAEEETEAETGAEEETEAEEETVAAN